MAIDRDSSGKIKPGSGGRPVGSRNKLQADFVNALADDFKEHGEAVIKIVRAERPAEYLKVIANILPKEFLLSEPVAGDMTDDDLDAAIAYWRGRVDEKAKPH